MRLRYITRSILLLLMIHPVLCQNNSVVVPAPTVAAAADAIFSAFQEQPLVGLGDSHGLAQEEDFYVSLVRDPRFATQVGNVVVEFGDAAQQDTIDRYVNGEDIPYPQLRRVWADAVGWFPTVTSLGVVVDTSGSVRGQLARSRAEAQEAVQKLLLHSGDEGTAVEFGRSRRVIQDWTSQKSVLMDGIGHVGGGPRDPIDGTSVLDALFSTCFYEFGKASVTGTANAIVLFTDGEDTASSVSLASAASECRENHVALYAFSPKPSPETTSLGPATLRQLTEQTGGRLFYVDDPDGDVHADIDTVGNLETSTF